MGSTPALYRNLQFDMARDFIPVVGLTSSASILVVNPSLPVTTLKEFIEYVRARPGKVFFGTSGVGVSDNLAAELFRTEAKLDMVHVPYKDGNLSTTDVISGRISMRVIGMAEVPLVKAEKLRALAVTTPKRSKILPEVPTIAESGLPRYDYQNFSAIYAPAGTPRPIVIKLNGEVIKILALSDMRARFDSLGVEPVGGTPQELAASFKADIARWKKVVEVSGINPLD
jgi:tripartite-type tricarboxylate transporter receptor subunit TctC